MKYCDNNRRKRSPKICVIGAGFSGICAAIQLQNRIPSTDLTIFDENKEVGGTWYMNTYPGCAPDVASHLYSYSFEPNPNWSQAFAPQAEVLQYLKDIARKHDLYSKIQFNHTVEKLQWDETVLGWRVRVLNKETSQISNLIFDFVITAHGRFHLPKTPEEFKPFKGPIMHSAEWDEGIELKGKTVAVIGSGSSATQLIPNIVKRVKRLLIYQRHAGWAVPKNQFRFPEIIKWAFAKIPGLQWAYRAYLYWMYQTGAPCFRPDTFANKLAQRLSKFHLWKQVKDPHIREQLKPNYEFGCKRVTPTSDFYPVFNLPSVQLVSSPIRRVTEDSIITDDGKELKIEVLVLATGFQVQDSFGSIEIRGRSGEDLLRSWVIDRPRSYLSVMSSHAPNLFILLGPNSSIGYTSILFPLECQVHWITTLLIEMEANGWRCVTPKKSAEDNYMTEIDNMARATIIGSGSCAGCDSWYLNPRGVLIEIFPGSTKLFWESLKTVKIADLEFS